MKTNTLILSALLVITIFAAMCSGATYYVATNGNDLNTGTTTGAPWRHISNAVTRITDGTVVPGDKVLIRQGTYRENIYTSHRPHGPIYISPFSNEIVTIKGSQIVNSWINLQSNIWYVTNWTRNSQQVFINATSLQMLGWPNNSIRTSSMCGCPPCGSQAYIYIPYGFSCSNINQQTHTIDIGNPLTNMPTSSFYYDAFTHRLYINPPSLTSPITSIVEVSSLLETNNGHVWRDEGNMHISGLTFMHSSTLEKHPLGYPMVFIGDGSSASNCTITWGDSTGATPGNNSHLSGCTISHNGKSGISAGSSSFIPMSNIVISNCRIISNNNRYFFPGLAEGIRIIPHNDTIPWDAGAVIKDNEIAYNYSVGLWIDSVTGNYPKVLSGNRIHHNRPTPQAPYADTAGMKLELSREIFAYNNLVYSNATYNLIVEKCADIELANNTFAAPIHLANTSGKANVRINYNSPIISTNISFINNSVINAAWSPGDSSETHDLLLQIGGGQRPELDYNLYRHLGTTNLVLYQDSVLFSSLAAWKTGTLLDSNSISLEPNLLTGTRDRYIFIPARSSKMISAGTDVPYINSDILNNIRPIALCSNPSIGAVESPFKPRSDYNGDWHSDMAVYYTNNNTWYIRDSRDGSTFGGGPFSLGVSEGQPVSGDFDGDSIADIAVYKKSTGYWYIRNSSTLITNVSSWGWSAADPVPGDYDGDGKTDLAVFHVAAGNWYIRRSSDLQSQVLNWGSSTATPVPGDYDGDSLCDLAVRYPSGNWHIRYTASGTTMVVSNWGTASTKCVQDDYDGDGITDIAYFAPSNGTWCIRQSGLTNQPLVINWGWSAVTPVPKDFDGDQRADCAVYYQAAGTWYIRQSSNGQSMPGSPFNWGWSATIPVH